MMDQETHSSKTKITVQEEAKKIYNELYPQFDFFGNRTLIIIGIICLLLILLNNGDIIVLGKGNFFIILILILSVGRLLYKIGEYIGFIEGYEMGHKKGFDNGRKKGIK